MGRCAIFIDGGYLSKVLAKEFDTRKIDINEFSKTLANGYDLLRTYYYTCVPYQSNPPTEDEKERISNAQKFHYTLSRFPSFQLRLGKLEKGYDKNGSPYFYQKRVDVLLSIDLVSLSIKNFIDTAIIVAGDSDFIPAVDLVKNNGVRVILYCGNSPHDELINKSDIVMNISRDLIDKVSINNNK